MATSINFKLSIFYQDGSYGFSENWYVGGSGKSYDDMLKLCSDYADVRRPMLGITTQILGYRVSDDLIFRDSRIKKDFTFGTYAGGSKQKLANGQNSTRIYSRIMARCDMGSGSRAIKFVAGIPQGVIQNPAGPFSAFDPIFAKAWDNWAKFVVDNKLCLKQWVKALTHGTVVSYTQDPDPHYVQILLSVALPALVDPANSWRVRIYGVLPKYTKLNRDYSFFPTTVANTYRVRVASPLIQPQANAQGSFVLLTQGYPQVDRVEYDGETSRKSGRPFNSPRGKLLARFRT